MDAQRFDDLARLFAQSASRRTVWRGALAAAAGWFASRTVKNASAQDECGGLFFPCNESTPCCPDLGCCGGQCCGGPDYTCCDDFCTSLLVDATNCGSCGNTCEEGSQCCSGVCASLLDPTNCGECGTVCAPCQACTDLGGGIGCVSTCGPDEGCVDGVCVTCPPGMVNCFDRCVDLLTDDSNCGECGFSCGNFDINSTPIGTICVGGHCVCPAGLTACFNQNLTEEHCYDLQTTSFNCGECENNCEEPPYPVGSICVDGTCVCPNGGRPCGDICCPDDSGCTDGVCGPCAEERTLCAGVCVDLATDTANCGACGRECEAGSSCVDGVCQASGGGDQPPPEPTSTAGPVTLPSTGTGARGRPSGRDNVPLIGAIGALSATIAAFLRTRLRKSETADRE